MLKQQKLELLLTNIPCIVSCVQCVVVFLNQGAYNIYFSTDITLILVDFPSNILLYLDDLVVEK